MVRSGLWVALFLFSVGVLMTPSPVAAQSDEASEQAVTIIAHPDVGTKGLDFDDLRALLLGNQRFWPGGLRVHLVIDGRRESEARRVWIEDITAMTDVQYTQYWIGMVFRGRATTAPHVVQDNHTAIALVASLPGAISVIHGPPSTDRVRVLGTVDDFLSER